MNQEQQIMSKKEFTKQIYRKKHRGKEIFRWVIAIPGGIGVLMWIFLLYEYFFDNPFHFSFVLYFKAFMKEAGSSALVAFILLILGIWSIVLDVKGSRELNEEYELYQKNLQFSFYQQGQNQQRQSRQRQSQHSMNQGSQNFSGGGQFLFCPNCGAKNSTGAKFCFQCGGKILN